MDEDPTRHISLPEGGRGGLLRAVAGGRLDAVKNLLDLDPSVDINYQNEHGSTALIEAATHNYTEIVELLLAAEANVDLRCQYNRTALMQAVESEHVDIVDLLLTTGADVNDRRNPHTFGETALMLAARFGSIGIVDRLLVHGANYHLVSDSGETALNYAAREGRTEVVDRLLAMGLDPNSQNDNGDTPLIQAARNNHVDIVHLLLSPENNVNPTIKNQIGKTALDVTQNDEIRAMLQEAIKRTQEQ